jgi:hypothetical protein
LGETVGTAVPVPSNDENKTYVASWEDKSGCFITTACIEAKGLPDYCLEINVMRQFRDEYIKNLPREINQIKGNSRHCPIKKGMRPGLFFNPIIFLGYQRGDRYERQ